MQDKAGLCWIRQDCIQDKAGLWRIRQDKAGLWRIRQDKAGLIVQDKEGLIV